MQFVNHTAECGMLKLMMDHTDDVIDLIEEDLFLSKEAKRAYRTIGAMSYHGRVTIRALQEAFSENETMLSYIEVVYRQTDVSKEDLEQLLHALQKAHMKDKAFRHAEAIMQAANGDDEEELQKLVENGIELKRYGEQEKLYEDTLEATRDWYSNFLEECKNPEKRGRLKLQTMPQLNDAFGGIDKIDLIMFCAKSGHGKTALALNLAKDFAIDQEKTVYYVNAEMSTDQLRERVMSNMAEIDAKEIDRRVFFGSEEENKQKHMRLVDAVDQFGSKKLILAQVPTIYPSKIRKAVKQLTLNNKRPDIIFVDYIRQMDPEVDTRGMQEYQIMYECAEACKRLATTLKIPVIALAQLNDQGMLEGSKKMRNACDGLLFFKEIRRHTDDIDDPKEKAKAQKEIEAELARMTPNVLKKADYKLIKEKVRRGDTSTPIYVRFHKNLMRVREIE